MKKTTPAINISVAMLIHLIMTIVSIPVLGQQADTTIVAQVQPPDTIKRKQSPAKIFSELAQYLVNEQQCIKLSPPNSKEKYNIKDSSKLFQVPDGESRVALFELPAYIADYQLIIKSKVQGFGFTWHFFGPSCVFLDSSFRPIRFLAEKNFIVMSPQSFKAIHLKAEMPIDNERQGYKYLLLYTASGTDRLGTYHIKESDDPLMSLLKHPLKKSPFGKLELELHLR